MKHISKFAMILIVSFCLTACAIFSNESNSDPAKNLILQEAEQVQTVYWTLSYSKDSEEAEILQAYKEKGYSDSVINRARELWYQEQMSKKAEK